MRQRGGAVVALAAAALLARQAPGVRAGELDGYPFVDLRCEGAVDDGRGAFNFTSTSTAVCDCDSVIHAAYVAIEHAFDPATDALACEGCEVGRPGRPPVTLTAAYDAGVGVLSLRGAASVAEYTTALASVKYSDGVNGTRGYDVSKRFRYTLGRGRYLPDADAFYEVVGDGTVGCGDADAAPACSWPAAQRSCADPSRDLFGVPGHLVTIPSIEVADALAPLLATLSPLATGWLGAVGSAHPVNTTADADSDADAILLRWVVGDPSRCRGRAYPSSQADPALRSSCDVGYATVMNASYVDAPGDNTTTQANATAAGRSSVAAAREGAGITLHTAAGAAVLPCAYANWSSSDDGGVNVSAGGSTLTDVAWVDREGVWRVRAAPAAGLAGRVSQFLCAWRVRGAAPPSSSTSLSATAATACLAADAITRTAVLSSRIHEGRVVPDLANGTAVPIALLPEYSCTEASHGVCVCSDVLDGASLAIVDGVQPEDTLECTACGTLGIAAVFNNTAVAGAGSGGPRTAALMLRGAARASEYATALQSVVFATTSTANASRTIAYALGDVVYWPRGGSFYRLRATPGEGTWYDAQRDCATGTGVHELPGYLVTVASAGEQAFLDAVAPLLPTLAGGGGYVSTWIGALDVGQEGSFRWAVGPEGCPATYTGDGMRRTACDYGWPLRPDTADPCWGGDCEGGGCAVGGTNDATAAPACAREGGYANWATNEPDDNSTRYHDPPYNDTAYASGEDYAYMVYDVGLPGYQWRDARAATQLEHHICEYGGVGNLCFADAFARGVVHLTPALDECVGGCATCAAGACGDPEEQECTDPNHDATSLGDWFCECIHANASGHALARRAHCRSCGLDECRSTSTEGCLTCGSCDAVLGTACVDPTPHAASVNDWECRCMAPATAAILGVAAADATPAERGGVCAYDECDGTCASCEDGTCRAGGQMCDDFIPHATSLGDWRCRCRAPSAGWRVGGVVDRCVHDECRQCQVGVTHPGAYLVGARVVEWIPDLSAAACRDACDAEPLCVGFSAVHISETRGDHNTCVVGESCCLLMDGFNIDPDPDPDHGFFGYPLFTIAPAVNYSDSGIVACCGVDNFATQGCRDPVPTQETLGDWLCECRGRAVGSPASARAAACTLDECADCTAVAQASANATANASALVAVVASYGATVAVHSRKTLHVRANTTADAYTTSARYATAAACAAACDADVQCVGFIHKVSRDTGVRRGCTAGAPCCYLYTADAVVNTTLAEDAGATAGLKRCCEAGYAEFGVAPQICEDPDVSAEALGDWVCRCNATRGLDGVPAAPASRAVCAYDECLWDDVALACAAAGHACDDPNPREADTGDFLCACAPPARGPAAIGTAAPTGPCLLDECHDICATCENATCTRARPRQVCQEPNLTQPADWLCVCAAPAVGNATASRAECVLNECEATCGTCENGECGGYNTTCRDPSPDDRDTLDWVCVCPPPAEGVPKRGDPQCGLDECAVACGSCANATCAGAAAGGAPAQTCVDPVATPAALYDWECRCDPPGHGAAVGARVADCSPPTGLPATASPTPTPTAVPSTPAPPVNTDPGNTTTPAPAATPSPVEEGGGGGGGGGMTGPPSNGTDETPTPNENATSPVNGSVGEPEGGGNAVNATASPAAVAPGGGDGVPARTLPPPTALPTTAAPTTGDPRVFGSTGEPSTARPATAAPATLVPNTAEPSTAAPGGGVGATGVPNTAAPPTLIPNTAAPSTGRPTTGTPWIQGSTGQPLTGAPNTAAPATGVPRTLLPTTGKPTTGTPTTGEPTTGQPTTGRPTTGRPTTGRPTTAVPSPSPAAESRAYAEESVHHTGEPTTGEPTTGEPTTGEPTTGRPTTGRPTTGRPTTGRPGTLVPVTRVPGTPAVEGDECAVHGGVCEEVGQVCRGEGEGVMGGWGCRCVAPFTGLGVRGPAVCHLDECEAVCATCERGACGHGPDPQQCVDANTHADALSDWACSCAAPLTGTATRARARCELDECTAVCASCGSAVCNEPSKVLCHDPNTAPAALSDWTCACVAPTSGFATGARPECLLNECTAQCPTCAGATCRRHNQDCWDADASPASTGDWVCRCRDGGEAARAPAECRVDECMDGAGVVCGTNGQACTDPDTRSVARHDWVCSCVVEGAAGISLRPPPQGVPAAAPDDGATASRVAGLAVCDYNECDIVGCGTCANDTCAGLGRGCYDPNPTHGARHDWECACPPPSEERAYGASVYCIVDECTFTCDTCAGATCDGQSCRDADPRAHKLGDWRCSCLPPATGVAVVARAACDVDECRHTCATCAAETCAPYFKDCRDPNTSASSLGDWYCDCPPPAVDVSGICELDECAAICGHCANNTCDGDRMACEDPALGAWEVRDWFCVCEPPAYGRALTAAPVCRVDDCGPGGTGAVCAEYQQTCVDSTVDVVDDFVCMCPPPALGSRRGSAAVCILNECMQTCATCENGGCGRATQTCSDPDTSHLSVGDWTCACRVGYIGDPVVAGAARCMRGGLTLGAGGHAPPRWGVVVAVLVSLVVLLW